MKKLTLLMATAASAPIIISTPAFAQGDIADNPTSDVIVVTARKREETLLDVPVALTAVSGDTLEQRGINSVREAAALSPGLNITSDGTGRAFVSIRGVGVTLVQSVQPGVGLFIDGIYRPSTAYLNNPLLDVERIEVLRGPQGTLYGKNTLGGAINVVSRKPGNELEVRGLASYANPDDSWLVSGSISGAIIPDKLKVRVAASHREQGGFLYNPVLDIQANPLNTDSVNATVISSLFGDAELTINGYYDWIEGANTPYARVTGPTDYSRIVQFNSPNITEYKYRGVNARFEVPIPSLNTDVTLIGAYDLRDSTSLDGEGDFGPFDIVRLSGTDELRTKTAELRFDSEWSDQFSSLLGFFYSRETTATNQTVDIIPFSITNNAISATEADTYAAFGTLFWSPNDAWEVAAGIRYDHEDREATGAALIGGMLTPIPAAQIESDEVQPRFTLSRRWDAEFMTYASVSRGYRGGGFNSPLAPTRTYQGDSAWVYELGSRYVASDGSATLSGAIFYSDYSDYIGLNSIAPSAAGGLVTVDLNSGDVESYGVELEAALRPMDNWSITSGFTYMHARLTDSSPYTAITGRVLSSDRLTFQPDWSFSVYSDYVVPIGNDSLTFTAGLVGKGERLAATLNETTPTFLDSYILANAALTYRRGGIELSIFGDNIFNADYFDSYIEQTTLALAGLPASDLGIIGDPRRYGVRLRFEY